jgi:DNA polymerase III epsilon subunit-like protein
MTQQEGTMREIVIDTETTGFDPLDGPSIMTMSSALAD